MLEQRRTRADQTREATAPRTLKWSPPSMLPDPSPRPGWVHRWCAVSVYNEAAPTINSRLAEGWEKCLASEYPEVLAKIINSSKDDSILTGGLILCRAPRELMVDRAEQHAAFNRQQMAGVRHENAAALNEDKRYANAYGNDLQASATDNGARRLEFGDGK